MKLKRKILRMIRVVRMKIQEKNKMIYPHANPQQLLVAFFSHRVDLWVIKVQQQITGTKRVACNLWFRSLKWVKWAIKITLTYHSLITTSLKAQWQVACLNSTIPLWKRWSYQIQNNWSKASFNIGFKWSKWNFEQRQSRGT